MLSAYMIISSLVTMRCVGRPLGEPTCARSAIAATLKKYPIICISGMRIERVRYANKRPRHPALDRIDSYSNILASSIIEHQRGRDGCCLVDFIEHKKLSLR